MNWGYGRAGGWHPACQREGCKGEHRSYKAQACEAGRSAAPAPPRPSAAAAPPGLAQRLPPGRAAPRGPLPPRDGPTRARSPTTGRGRPGPRADTRGGRGRAGRRAGRGEEQRGRRPVPSSSALLGRAAAGTRPDWREPAPSSSSFSLLRGVGFDSPPSLGRGGIV